MPDNYLDLFLPKKPKQGPPAPAPDLLDQTYRKLGTTRKAVYERRKAAAKPNEAALGKARQGIEAARLSPEDDSLAKSIVFMSSKNDAGEELSPLTGVGDLGEFKPTVSYEDAIAMVKDPARRKQWADSVKLWRDQRAVRGNVNDPSYRSAHPQGPGGLSDPARTPETESADRTAKMQRAWEESGGRPLVFLQHPDFSFQELRDEAAHRIGAVAARTTPSSLALGAAGLPPDELSRWSGNAVGKLIGGAALDLPAALEFSGDPSKPVLDRLMAAGQAALMIAVSGGSHGPVSGIEEAVKKVSAKSGLPEEAVAAAVNRADVRPGPDMPVTSPAEAPTSAKAVSEPSTIASEGRAPEAPPTTLEAPRGTVALPEGQSLSTPPQSTRRTVMDVQSEIDQVRAARKARIEEAASGGRMNASAVLDPQDIKDALTLGRLHFEKGLRSFDDWSREMIGAFGTAIRSHLPDIWRQVSGPVEGDSVARLQDALKEATPLRSDFAAQLSEKARAEKAGRLAGAQSASVGKSMSEGMSRQMGSQKGSFANYSFELPSPIDAEDLAHLKDMVLTHPKLRPYEKLNAQLALEKIAGDGQYGGLPTEAEISALERVFGKGVGTKLRTMQTTSIYEELVLHRKAFLLSGPRTVLRNLIGNAVNAVRNEVGRPFDALNDQLVRLAFPKATEGRRTVAWGLAPSADRTRTVVQKTTQDVAEIMQHGQTWEGSVEVLKESRDPLARYALRFQGVQDAAWMNAAYERSLAEQASLMVKKDPKLDFRSLMDSPTEAMAAQAEFDSQVSTFNAPNQLAKSLVSLTKVPGIGPVVEFLIPFKKVPSNIASELAQGNPLGVMVNWSRAFHEAKTTGKLSYATQRQLAKATTNGTLGTALLWYGAELARKGLLTGSAPTDPAQKTTNEALGIRPASLQIGDSRYQLTGTHPMLSVLALGASMYESAQKRYEAAVAQADRLKSKGQDPADFGVKPQTGDVDVRDAGSWVVAMGSIMQEQPFLKGIKDLADAAQSERQVQTFVNSAAASFVPAIVPDVMRAMGKGDDVIRDPANPAEAWRARMGFGKDLPAKHDAFGREVKLGGVFDVTNAKEVRTDPVSLLMKQNGLRVTKLQRVGNEPQAHYEERERLYGQFLYHVLNSIVNESPNPEIPALSQIKDKKVLREVWDKINGAVRTKLEGALDTGVLKTVNENVEEESRKITSPKSPVSPTGG